MNSIFKKGLFTIALLAVFAVCTASFAEMVDKVIVVVNNEVVTQREFDRMFTPIKKSYESNFKGEELQKRLEMARKGLLEQLINSKLAISLAKQEGIKINESELQERVGQVKAFYGSDQAFAQALDEKGTNLTEFENEIRDQMLAQKLVEKEVIKNIDISPSEIKDVYEQNQDQFLAPKQVKIRGILIRKTGDRREDAEAKKKANEVAKRIKKGEDFASVAGEVSEGPYAQKNGDMGYQAKGQLLPEIDEAVFVLKKGQVTGIVETAVGYHIFKAEDIKEPRVLELGEVSDFIKGQLFKQRFQVELVKWLEKKRKDALISYK
jgi:parvulin-like peptidyl-prolyl isomerase